MPDRDDFRDAEEVRSELKRITASPEFRSAERLTRLLTHVVEHTLQGNSDRLKEIVLGGEVFDRRNFDPRTDPIVRVEASRLRKRLDDFYRRSGCPSGLMIVLHRGTYAPSFGRVSIAASAPETPRQSDKVRVAVAPLSEHGSPHSAVFLVDDIIHALTRRPKIEVAVWSAGCESEGDAILVAKDLGIRYLVTLIFRERYAAVRVIDVQAGSYLWSERLDATKPAEVQTLSTRIVEALTGREQDAGVPPVRHAAAPAAYNLYLKGRYYWNLRTEPGLWKAVDFFEQAIAQDPECALACTGLADAYTLLANYGAAAPSDVRPRAKEFALRAMEIDARLSEAHTSLAHVHATYEWDWQTAELEYLTAIRLNPSYATSHHWYAITLLAPLRRLSEALEEIRRARECDAISLGIRRDEALVQLYDNDAEAALASATQLIALDSRFAGAWWLMGLIAEQQNRFDAGIEAQRRAVELSSRQPRMLGALGHVLGRAGFGSEAGEILNELEHLSAGRYVSPFDVALVHLGLDHTDAAFSYLNRALSLRSYELVTLQVDPRYAPLRPFRGYEELRRTLGF